MIRKAWTSRKYEQRKTLAINSKDQGCHTLWELREFRETQGIFKLKKISGRLRESQGILIYFLNSGKLREVLIISKKFREVLKFSKSQDNFLLYLEWDLINLVEYFVEEINFI